MHIRVVIGQLLAESLIFGYKHCRPSSFPSVTAAKKSKFTITSHDTFTKLLRNFQKQMHLSTMFVVSAIATSAVCALPLQDFSLQVHPSTSSDVLGDHTDSEASGVQPGSSMAGISLYPRRPCLCFPCDCGAPKRDQPYRSNQPYRSDQAKGRNGRWVLASEVNQPHSVSYPGASQQLSTSPGQGNRGNRGDQGNTFNLEPNQRKSTTHKSNAQSEQDSSVPPPSDLSGGLVYGSDTSLPGTGGGTSHHPHEQADPSTGQSGTGGTGTSSHQPTSASTSYGPQVDTSNHHTATSTYDGHHTTSYSAFTSHGSHDHGSSNFGGDGW
ncbi:hypothetical protein FB446DRAFT_197171 [Lentinula raphanica]|nr:hypothetical protein FB446DRAFT_197171 [Lentinula raphanica]